MDIPESIVKSGLDQAWSRLCRLDPAEVCLRSGATFDRTSRTFSLHCFGQPISLAPEERSIEASTGTGRLLTSQLAELFNLSLVWYLNEAKDAGLSGRLVRPTELPGGDMFASGTHVLPLDQLTARFGEDSEGFLRTGDRLSAQRPDYGDAALELRPFPRVPVVVVLWTADEEFPARASLLFDSTAHLHLPVDILWSTAMLSLQLLLLAGRDR